MAADLYEVDPRLKGPRSEVVRRAWIRQARASDADRQDRFFWMREFQKRMQDVWALREQAGSLQTFSDGFFDIVESTFKATGIDRPEAFEENDPLILVHDVLRPGNSVPDLMWDT